PPEAALPVPRQAFTTNGEADSVREVVEKNRYRSILLVTSPYHSRRAFAVFRKEFRGRPVEVQIAVCDPPAFLDKPWWCSHMGVKTIVGEYCGLAYYQLRGWV
ncbi:MAG: YdcF family protein, partial [bacterium]